jgi:Helix-turn-helix of DDE superfamily endonuclease
MTYKQLKELKPEAFKRRCGLQMETFDRIIEILNPHLDRKGKRGGQCKLSVEDRLLVVIEYWREYRTQFHIGTSWNLSESSVCRLISKVERLLMDSGKFRLPGKKQLYQQADNWQVIVKVSNLKRLEIDRVRSMQMPHKWDCGSKQKRRSLSGGAFSCPVFCCRLY